MHIKKAISALSLLVAFFVLLSTYNEHLEIERVYDQVSAVVQTQDTVEDISTTAKHSIADDTYVVVRVIDGDTIEVTKDGVKEKVRLIGINTPETVDPRRKVECFGKEASAYAKAILVGRKVGLISDDSQTKYDKYGRLLAYIYREDGLFVNKHMIEKGYAYEYTYKVPYLFQKEFKEAQKRAEREGKGLWGVGVCE